MAILILEAVSKQHLASDSRVADLFKMLTYSNVCCAFSSVCALLSNAIRHFETASGRPGQNVLKIFRSPVGGETCRIAYVSNLHKMSLLPNH